MTYGGSETDDKRRIYLFFCRVKYSRSRLRTSHLHRDSDKGLRDKRNKQVPCNCHVTYTVVSSARSDRFYAGQQPIVTYRRVGRKTSLHVIYS